ncbi:MAG: hypothetical protein QW166_01400 [Candidatus Bathyarchaeia archaeon]
MAKFSASKLNKSKAASNSEIKKYDSIKKITKLILLFLLFSLASTIILIIAALSKGIGYDGSINVVSTELIVPGHPCRGVKYIVEVNLTYNPFFYLVSYINGGERVSGIFSAVYYPSQTIYYLSSSEIEEVARNTLARSEVITNLPYLLMLGFITGFLILTIYRIVRGKIMKKRLAIEEEIKEEDAWVRFFYLTAAA